jgi:hypothetical protein
VSLVPLDLRNSSLLGAYWNAVDRAKAGDVDALRPFEHLTIYDLNGNPYRLLTDINTIYSLEQAMVFTGGDAYFRRHYGGARRPADRSRRSLPCDRIRRSEITISWHTRVRRPRHAGCSTCRL